MPAQTHSTLDDPWREQEELDQTVRDVEAGGGTIEVFDYPGSGHFFTDPTLPAEYDPVATETFWSRVPPFVRACGLDADNTRPTATAGGGRNSGRTSPTS